MVGSLYPTSKAGASCLKFENSFILVRFVEICKSLQMVAVGMREFGMGNASPKSQSEGNQGSVRL